MLVALGCAAPAAHATLGVPTGGPPAIITGHDASTANALASFEALIGGADNGTTAGEQGRGFRRVSWDGIATDGREPGSIGLAGGHTTALGRSTLQPWGIDTGPEIAVANDGFHSVNSGVQFAPFSDPNVWAPFNSNTAELDVVAPGGQSSTPVPAETRGLGAVFLNVGTSGTSIQLYSGDIPLLSQPAPAPTGATSFVGVLFPNAVVTRVVITLGTGEIFDFDGNAVTPGSATGDLVAGDDVVLSEPSPARGAVAATVGVPVTATLDSFTESNALAFLHDVVDWGDGTRSIAPITTSLDGTFQVSGDHAYAHTGSYLATVTVDDSSGPEQTREIDVTVGPRSTTTAVTCSPSAVAVSASTTCTATVVDFMGGVVTAPAGLVSFGTPTPGAAFPVSSSCQLGPTATAGVSSCAVQLMPGQLPPGQARATATYTGDSAHAASSGTATVSVHAQRCTLKALARRLRPQGLGVLVTCDARAGVHITARAVVARKGRLKAFQRQFGTVSATVAGGRPTVLVIKPGHGALPPLRSALRRHQHVSLKLTLTATSHATTRRTTTRVSAIRLR